jgi:hypothetical protein
VNRSLWVFPILLVVLFPVAGVLAEEVSAVPAAESGLGPLREKEAASPGAPGDERAGLNEAGDAGAAGSEKEPRNGPGPDGVQVDLGKVWNVSPAYFRKVFDGEGRDEPSGLKAKVEQNLSGTIQTKWGPADLLFGSLARFFASSPVLLDREYAVRRSMLYEE